VTGGKSAAIELGREPIPNRHAFNSAIASGDLRKMDSNIHFFTVWTHRSAKSIFGADSHPVSGKSFQQIADEAFSDFHQSCSSLITAAPISVGRFRSIQCMR
jgi:hypothetical protein